MRIDIRFKLNYSLCDMSFKNRKRNDEQEKSNDNTFFILMLTYMLIDYVRNFKHLKMFLTCKLFS